jgi:F0F1-type ATP synthase membrane subunit a
MFSHVERGKMLYVPGFYKQPTTSDNRLIAVYLIILIPFQIIEKFISILLYTFRLFGTQFHH